MLRPDVTIRREDLPAVKKSHNTLYSILLRRVRWQDLEKIASKNDGQTDYLLTNAPAENNKISS